MARRRSIRRGKWLLIASAAAGGGTYGWLHTHWLSYAAAALPWALYAALRLARRHRPHRHVERPRRQPAAPATHAPIDFEPHGKYHAYDRAGDVDYVGINVIGDSRDFLTRATEHVRNEPWWDDEVAECRPVAWYPNRLAALANEAWDIHTLDPPRNKTHRNWMHTLEDCPTIARARAAGYTVPSRPAARADPAWQTP